MTVNPDLSVVVSFVGQLRHAGVRHVCISPGSRSTPLTAACVREPALRTWLLLDERSAGFFAVGLARMTKQPVVLVCTSGTAAANYFPAVMEARQSRVPLLIVTADRPPELRGVGSNQTVDQVKLYGAYVKWQTDMPTPDGGALLDEQSRTAVFRATAAALAEPAGPVHINWPFREPLLPPVAVADRVAATGSEAEDGSLIDGIVDTGRPDAATSSLPLPGGQPFVRVRRGVRSLPDSDLRALADELSGRERGLLVCGPQDDPRLAESLRLLADALRYPLLADPLSQARTVSGNATLVIDTYDVMLRAWHRAGADSREALRPEVVLRFGQTPTSKALGSFLSQHRNARQIVVDESENWQDPFFCATDVLACDAVDLVNRLVATVRQRAGSGFAQSWLAADASVAATRSSQLLTIPFDAASTTGAVREEAMFEGRLFVELAQLLPADAVLFVGNSMPVRDLDSFFPKGERPLHILANRGVSGIDGVASTALGVAAGAAERGRKAVLVIGDVSFYHDANGLLAARQYGLDLTIILVHNDGGGIFSLLPQAQEDDVFPYFTTPHGLDFEPLVRMYGGVHTRIENWSHFKEAVTQSLRSPGLRVLEIRSNKEINAAWHQRIFDVCTEALSP